MTEDLMKFQARPFGEQVRMIRTRLRMSQAELGRKIGISQAAVCQIESSNSAAQGATMRRFAQALGVSEYLGNLVPPWIAAPEEESEF